MSTEQPGFMKRYGDPILTGVIATVLGTIVVTKFLSTPSSPVEPKKEQKKNIEKTEEVRPLVVSPSPPPQVITDPVPPEEKMISPTVQARYFVDENGDGYGDPDRPAKKGTWGAVANGSDHADGKPCILRVVRSDGWPLCREGGGGTAVLEVELVSPQSGHGVAGAEIAVQEAGGEAFRWIRSGVLHRQDKENVLTSTVTTDGHGRARITFDIPASAGRAANIPQRLRLGYMPDRGQLHVTMAWTAKVDGAHCR